MKQAIMIGAGNIGRGFIGAILSRSGYHVTFADVNMTLIDAINAEGRYTVHIQDRNPAAFTITNIDGISSAGPELAEALKTAELVTTAVGLRILPIVAKPIAAGIAARKAAGNAAPLNIVACENAVRATSQLKNAVYALLDDETKAFADANVGFADCAVDRIVPKMDFADPLVDPKTGTFGVRAELSNPNQKLLPGQFTKVKLLLDVRERSIVVPRKALSIEKGGAFIYIIRRDDIAEKRFVQTGPEIGNKVVIERGLGENERVVVEGYHKLVPGVKVHAVEAGDEKAIQALREEEEQ